MLGKPAVPPSEQDIADLERTVSHPQTVPVVEFKGGKAYVISIYGLYWAVHRMLREAILDKADAIEQAVAKVVVPDIEPSIDP